MVVITQQRVRSRSRGSRRALRRRAAQYATVVALAFANACAAAPRSSATPLPAARPGLAVYDGTVVIDPRAGTLDARWRIELSTDDLRGDSATFVLNERLNVSRLAGGDVAGFSRAVRSGLARLTVRFAPDVHARRRATLEIAYAGKPSFGDDSINGLRADWVELGLDSFWHPVVEGFGQAIVARARVVLPHGWQMVTSGRVARSGDTLVLANDVPLVDVALVAASAIRDTGDGHVHVRSTSAEGALVPKVLATGTSCARYLDARYGAAAPLPDVELVIAPRGGPGYARKNYIVLTRVADTATIALQRFVCHELAHFWSTGAIPSGPDNWLNEGFAEYVSARYVRTVSGEAAYRAIVAQWGERAQNTPPIWMPGATARPGPRVSYAKAPLLLQRLEKRVGTPVMERILIRYMDEPLRTTERVIEMVGEEAGVETAGWLRGELAR